MKTIPIDSTDAREQREIEAEDLARVHAEESEHRERCRDGWLGEDDAGRPIPCTRCRPRLVDVACRICQVNQQRCAEQVVRGRGRCCEYCNHSTETNPGGSTA